MAQNPSDESKSEPQPATESWLDRAVARRQAEEAEESKVPGAGFNSAF